MRVFTSTSFPPRRGGEARRVAASVAFWAGVLLIGEGDTVTFGKRFLIWAGTFVAALLLTALIAFPSPVAIIVLPLFPAGLLPFLGEKSIIGIVGWIVYFVLSVQLLRADDEERFGRLWIALCVLLVFNIGGCAYLVETVRLPHGA